jgi:hypothetical protein
VNLIDLAGKSRLRADGNALGNRRLVVDADVGRLIRREDIRLSLINQSLGEWL